MTDTENFRGAFSYKNITTSFEFSFSPTSLCLNDTDWAGLSKGMVNKLSECSLLSDIVVVHM